MRAIVCALLLSCGAATPPRAFTPGASRAPSPSKGWIQFEPQSTYFCARLPDGQIRALAYGVGTGFVLQSGVELTTAQRDATCGPRNIVVLGARGEMAYASNDGHFKMSYEMLGVEPAARSIGWLDGPCFVDDAGKVSCLADEKSAPSKLAALINAEGPVKELVRGVPCVLMRDGRVLCSRVNGELGLIPMWNDAVQASVYALGWSQYGGCAVLRSGKVSCLGEGWLGQRGYLAKIDSHVATEVPGLDGVDEVSASPSHACARRGGEVVCWGSAGGRACGDDAWEASRPIPACVVDQAATDSARRSYEEAERTCHDPKRDHGHDDPFCRSMWRSSPPDKVFVGGGVGCDPSGHEYYRWAPPTRVRGIDDAVAIGTGGLSCAMHASGSLTCWGAEQKGTRTLDFSPRTPAPPTPAPITVGPRGAVVSVGEDQAIVTTTASGAHLSYALGGKTIGPAVTLERDVVDAFAAYHRVCALHESGRVTCDVRDGASPPEPGFPMEPTAVRVFLSGSQGCVLRRDGVLRCGPSLGSTYASTREAAILSAASPITDAASSCALGSDGALRCIVRRSEPPRVVSPHADAISFDGSFGCVVAGGAVSCTGMNYAFQRGDEDQTGLLVGDKTTAIAGLPSITRVAVSTTHACALDETGDVYCWGRATDGETGAAAFGAASTQPDTNPIQRRLARPMRVPGVMHAIAIGAWPGRTCAITDAELLCWGRGMTGGVQRAPLPK